MYFANPNGVMLHIVREGIGKYTSYF